MLQLRFLCGQYPPEVHVHVRRYHKSELAKYQGTMDDWYAVTFVGSAPEPRKTLTNLCAFVG